MEKLMWFFLGIGVTLLSTVPVLFLIVRKHRRELNEVLQESSERPDLSDAPFENALIRVKPLRGCVLVRVSSDYATERMQIRAAVLDNIADDLEGHLNISASPYRWPNYRRVEYRLLLAEPEPCPGFMHETKLEGFEPICGKL